MDVVAGLIELKLPRETWQYRLLSSAGSRRLSLGNLRSRKCLIKKQANAKQTIRKQLSELELAHVVGACDKPGPQRLQHQLRIFTCWVSSLSRRCHILFMNAEIFFFFRRTFARSCLSFLILRMPRQACSGKRLSATGYTWSASAYRSASGGSAPSHSSALSSGSSRSDKASAAARQQTTCLSSGGPPPFGLQPKATAARLGSGEAAEKVRHFGAKAPAHL